MYDLIIIGGGPGGYMAAERAGQAGLRVLLAEKRVLGGVCLNEGCIPSKALLNSAKIYEHALQGEAYGVTATGVSVDHAAVIARKNKVVNTLTGGVKSLMKHSKVEVVYGEAFITDKNSIEINGETYSGNRMLIATGSAPIIPPIPGLREGLESGLVVTNREILDLAAPPEKLVIIGGGVIGLEMAAYFAAIGSRVTVIEMLPKIAGATDNDISDILLKSYRDKGIEFLLETRATAISDAGVEYEIIGADDACATDAADGTDGACAGNGHLPADKVLLSIGRRPVIEGYGLENTGVLIENGAIVTDCHCLTSIPTIYAAGDVNGKFMLAHAAYREAEVAVSHILGGRDVMRYDAVPSVIYTSPEVACAGDTEATAREKGIDVQAVSVPMAYSGRFVAENENTDGICKVVINKKTRALIGVHMIGSYASEIILSACAMIEMHMRVDDVRELIFPHPTVSEIIREAVFKL